MDIENSIDLTWEEISNMTKAMINILKVFNPNLVKEEMLRFKEIETYCNGKIGIIPIIEEGANEQ